MISSDCNSDNVYLKCANFRVYMFSANFGRFRKIMYTQNFLLNGVCDNKYTLKMHKIDISQNTRKKKYAQNSFSYIFRINQ